MVKLRLKKVPQSARLSAGGGVNTIWAMPTWGWRQPERGFPKPSHDDVHKNENREKTYPSVKVHLLQKEQTQLLQKVESPENRTFPPLMELRIRSRVSSDPLSTDWSYGCF